MNRRFLAVGDDTMPGNELHECCNDARFYEAMALQLGITADALTNSQSTKANVWAWMMDAQRQAIAGDLTYCGLAISNHGTHQMVNGELVGAICCYDMRAEGDNWWPGGLISAPEFQGWANGFPAACRVEVFLDICYSFSLSKALVHCPACECDEKITDVARHTEGCPVVQNYLVGKPKAIHNPGNQIGLFRMVAPQNQVHGKLNSNVVVWCACSQDQESADAPNLNNGAFTYFFKQAWQNNPKASRVELIAAIRPAIHAGGFNQVPRLACYGGTEQLPVGS